VDDVVQHVAGAVAVNLEIENKVFHVDGQRVVAVEEGVDRTDSVVVIFDHLVVQSIDGEPIVAFAAVHLVDPFTTDRVIAAAAMDVVRSATTAGVSDDLVAQLVAAAVDVAGADQNEIFHVCGELVGDGG
jgi:hypothetical protein